MDIFSSTTYNDLVCQQINDGIESVYNATVLGIKTEIEKDILTKVGKNWCADSAVSYFESFATNCNKESKDVYKVFKNFRDKTQKDIDAWRIQTGNPSVLQLKDFDEKEIVIDYQNFIKAADSNGQLYVSDDLESQLETSWVPTAKIDISTDVANALSERVVGNNIGDGLNEAINTSMEELAIVIDDMICSLTTEDSSIFKAVTNSRKQYSDTIKSNPVETKNQYHIDVNPVTNVSKPQELFIGSFSPFI